MYISPIDRELNDYKHAATLLLIMGSFGFLILGFMVFVIGSERDSHSISAYAGAMSTLLLTIPITGVGLYHALKFRMLKRLRWSFGEMAGIDGIGDPAESARPDGRDEPPRQNSPVSRPPVKETADSRTLPVASKKAASPKPPLCPCIAGLPPRGQARMASPRRPSSPHRTRPQPGRGAALSSAQGHAR